MAQIISVADDVYKTLKHMKGSHSYSEIIRGLISEKNNKAKILEFFGKGGINTEKIKDVHGLWNKWSEKYV